MPQLIGNLLALFNRSRHLSTSMINKVKEKDEDIFPFSKKGGLIFNHSTAPESLSRTFGDMKDRGEIEVPRNKLRGISDC